VSKRVFVRELSGDYDLRDALSRLQRPQRVVEGDKIPFAGGPQMWNKKLLDPADGLTQSMHAHVEVLAPGGRSQKHGHQNEAMLYILEGQGWEIHDGERYDWQAGDVVVVHNSCVHQHFNGSMDEPCKILIMKTKPLYLFLDLMYQGTVEGAPREAVPGMQGFDANEAYSVSVKESTEWSRGTNMVSFYADLLDGRVNGGVRGKRERKVVCPEDMPWEDCAQGRLKHVVHDQMDVRIYGHDAYIQIIDEGSSTGQHRHMWEEVMYVLEGEGSDLHWDARSIIGDTYEWEFAEEPLRVCWKEGDLIYVPPNSIHQHFAANGGGGARLLVASARAYRWLGFDEVAQIVASPNSKVDG